MQPKYGRTSLIATVLAFQGACAQGDPSDLESNESTEVSSAVRSDEVIDALIEGGLDEATAERVSRGLLPDKQAELYGSRPAAAAGTCTNAGAKAGPYLYSPKREGLQMYYSFMTGDCKQACIDWGKSLGYSPTRIAYDEPFQEVLYEITYDSFSGQCTLLRPWMLNASCHLWGLSGNNASMDGSGCFPLCTAWLGAGGAANPARRYKFVVWPNAGISQCSVSTSATAFTGSNCPAPGAAAWEEGSLYEYGVGACGARTKNPDIYQNTTATAFLTAGY